MRFSFDDAVLCFLRALFKIVGIVLRPPLDAKPRCHADGAADECDCDRPGFEFGSHMGSPKQTMPRCESRGGLSSTVDANDTRERGISVPHSVETQGSGAPCLPSWFLQDQSNCGLQELLYLPARRQDNFHGKL